MGKLKKFKKIIKKIIKNYANSRNYPKGINGELIFDEKHDHYQLVTVGWHEESRVYGCVIHFDIINNKIWIQHNGTEMELAKKLVKKGVSKNDIVIGLHSAYTRQFTEYAVN